MEKEKSSFSIEKKQINKIIDKTFEIAKKEYKFFFGFFFGVFTIIFLT